ncbi:hypothetical protein FB45DRAFT_483951 [Roridomyces roridus]|uniref:Uncharacterized protein n=1 Tax=Roridomyces roridus TaxID=1738132 RepID=A0AAD7C0C0_9AGAR|nr:hypothetical protein FB45DRAFT_483951 [Roridomyces roridus]
MLTISIPRRNPKLPTELECLIFETVALTHPEAVTKLLRVAKRVFAWIEPFLYRTLRIYVQSYAGLEVLKRMDTKGAEFFSKSVRNVEITSTEGPKVTMGMLGGPGGPLPRTTFWCTDDLQRILGACTQLQYLLLEGDLDADTLLPSLPLETRPAHVVLITHLARHKVNFGRPLFKNVTHLVVGDYKSSVSAVLPVHFDNWADILALPALTHLAIAHHPAPRSVESILSDAPHLRVLIVRLTKLREAEWYSSQHVMGDDRIVFMGYRNLQTRRVDEMWAEAEEFIRRRRTGVQPTPAHLFHPLRANIAPTTIPFRTAPRSGLSWDSGSPADSCSP